MLQCGNSARLGLSVRIINHNAMSGDGARSLITKHLTIISRLWLWLTICC